METPPRYGLHDSVGYWVNRLAAAMHDGFDRRASALDATAAQWAVLITVHNDDARTPGELARFIGIDAAAVTRLLDRLEAKDLVARRANETDRRTWWIELTEKGRELIPQLVEISHSENRRFLDRLTTEQADDFLRLLRAISPDDEV